MIKIKDKYKKYYLQNKVELVYRTGILEGLATSRLETEEIIKKGRSLEASYKDTQIVINIYNTWQKMMREEYQGSNKKVIEDMNRDIKRGMDDSDLTGKIRTNNVKISGTTYRPPSYRKYNLEELMMKLFKVMDVNTEDAFLYVYIHLMRTQFFVDGNKRTAYMFTNWKLMTTDMGSILYLPSEKSEREYLRRLGEFYENPKEKEYEFIKYLRQYYLKKV